VNSDQLPVTSDQLPVSGQRTEIRNPKSEIDPSPNSPTEYGWNVHVYTANFGFEWIIISTEGIADYGPGNTAYRGYQTWLNYKTGEIRFLYNDLRDEAATAEIGLVDSLIFTGNNVIVSKNDAAGATDGMGYKFTPAPPQPTKVYDVEVDPLIQSVIFMQTGYSGTFAPMTVTAPNGSAVNCGDTANVRCLTVDSKPGDRMVQFVQVNTNAVGGVYKATVSVGASGSGTFSFNALAASDLRASSPDQHTLALKAHVLRLDLGRKTDNGQLQAWLQTPNGAAFGSPFTMYDDGGHEDGEDGDGRFGSDPFTPPAAGAAYLWADGVTGGVAFRRSDPAPFNFQPLEVWAAPPYQEGFYSDSIPAWFYVTNQHSARHCYAAEFTVPAGWWYTTPNPTFCIDAGATAGTYVWVGRDLSNEAKGEVGEVIMTLTEIEEGAIAGSAGAQVALFRRPAALEFDNRQLGPLRPNGADTADLTLNLIDDLGQVLGYSGPFNGELTAQGGTVNAPTGLYEDGRLPLVFTAGTTPGKATINVMAEGGLTAETSFILGQPFAAAIDLTAATIDLSNAPETMLTATVLDTNGAPAPGRTVRLSVSDDDGAKGTILGKEVYQGTTGPLGRVQAKFVKTPEATGTVVVRAELLSPSGEVLQEDSVVLYLSEPPPGLRFYLPAIRGQ
jgi:hypothetical protein